MSAVDTERFRTVLLEERKRVTDALGYVQAENPHNDPDAAETRFDNHLAEHATMLADQELDDALEENAENLLAQIDAALGRIDAGTFGVCEGCGGEIPVERLEAVPFATQCIDCKRRHEGA